MMIFKNSINEHLEIIKSVYSIENEVEIFASKIIDAFKNGNKLLIMGNGGSASDSQHMATEIVVRYKKKRRGLPALALTTDTSILTAAGNDYSFKNIFSRQIEALAVKNDIVLCISTSGESENIINAIKEAKKSKCYTIGLLGNDGGSLLNMVDLPVVVKSKNTARIQECHGLIIHIVCEMIEEDFCNA